MAQPHGLAYSIIQIIKQLDNMCMCDSIYMIYIYIYMCICIHKYTCMSMHSNRQLPVYTCMSVWYMYIHIYIHIYVYIYVHVYIHVYTFLCVCLLVREYTHVAS